MAEDAPTPSSHEEQLMHVAALHNSLYKQSTEIARAFQHTLKTVKQCHDLLASRHHNDTAENNTSNGNDSGDGDGKEGEGEGEGGLPEKLLLSLANSCHRLFSFLFEGVLLHQLGTHELVADIARAQPLPQRQRPAVVERVTALLQCPYATQRRQTRMLHRFADRGERRGPGGRGAARAVNFTFAVSSRYLTDAAGLQQLLSSVHRVGGTAVLLPPGTEDTEALVAARLACCCLVAPPGAERERERVAGAGRLASSGGAVALRRISLESLVSSIASLKPNGGSAGGGGTSAAAAVDDAVDWEDGELQQLLRMLDVAPAASLPGSPRESGGPFLEPDYNDDDTASQSSSSASATEAFLTREDLFAPASHGRRRRPAARDATTGADSVPQWKRAATEAGSLDYRAYFERTAADGEELELLLSQAPPESQLIAYMAPAAETGVAEADAPEVRAVESLPPSEWVFQISHSVKAAKQAVAEAVVRLGSRLDPSSRFSPQCTHLVVAEGLTERTEKFLGACAARRLIVSPRYVLDSDRRGRWILGHMHEYNVSPRRRHPSSSSSASAAAGLPFAAWRVMLCVCHPAVAAGIASVLAAGGCTDCETCVFLPQPPVLTEEGRLVSEASAVGPAPEGGVTHNLTANTRFAEDYLRSRTHILVECQHMSARAGGYFELPQWFPVSLVRTEYYRIIFTLELLYYCLCTCQDDVFDAETGRLISDDRLQPACRVEPFQCSL